MKFQFVYPHLWVRHLRLRRALASYPLYDVPHKNSERDLPEASVRENFDYFMSSKSQRLSYLTEWLWKHFRVKITFDPQGIETLSHWMDNFAGGLTAGEMNDRYAFETYKPLWVGQLAGHNAIIDIGTFIGEYVIARRPGYYWDIYRGHLEEEATFCGPGYLRPTISGLPRGWKAGVITNTFRAAMDYRKASLIGATKSDKVPGRIISIIKSVLYMARASDETLPFIFGDSNNEPL
ncbi:hypothetical protein [Methylobacterium sp. Leaf85]|uniref:hypothetical protein n=1 Tax=Methylobacterium sp. Leaf85 TaxID=1736241 RepID=UPI000B1C65AD|nr:hypothetical protein [Methylobacterium sp. Leaf85]